MWKHKGKTINSLEQMPPGTIGFIYKITNLDTGRFYIGKKNVVSVTNPQISKKKYDELKAAGEPVTKTKDRKKSKKGSPVWRYKKKDCKKETNWKNYRSSSSEVLSDYKKGHKMEKEILRFCSSKKDLTFREVEEQIKQEVLDRCDCYNGNILSKFFKNVDCNE